MRSTRSSLWDLNTIPAGPRLGEPDPAQPREARQTQRLRPWDPAPAELQALGGSSTAKGSTIPTRWPQHRALGFQGGLAGQVERLLEWAGNVKIIPPNPSFPIKLRKIGFVDIQYENSFPHQMGRASLKKEGKKVHVQTSGTDTLSISL